MTGDDSSPPLTFSVIVEADNVRSTDLEVLRACLDSLAFQQPELSRASGVYLAVGDAFPDTAIDALGAHYSWLTVIRVAATTYVGLKTAGVGVSSSDVVVFCDSDVQYEPGWLEALLSGFGAEPNAHVVCGETSTPIQGPYGLAVALTFNFPRFSGDSRLAPAPMYWANNVAIRRTLVDAAPIPDPPELHRGQNIIHSLELGTRGLAIWRQPNARGLHRVPPLSEIARRYVTLGRDSATIERLTANDTGASAQVMAPDRAGVSQLGKFLGRVRQVIRANPLHALLLPLAAPFVGILGALYLRGKLSPPRIGRAGP